MYLKFKAPQIFTGTELIDGSDKVLITDAEGVIQGIVLDGEAGEGVQMVEGIVSPGFINAHCHLELSHMKGMIPAKTGLQEFVKQIVALRNVQAEQIQDAIIQAEDEMFANGIVAVGDICNTLDTLDQKGKKRIAYYSFIELYDLDPTRAHDKIVKGLEMQQQFYENCVRASLVPHAPYSVSFNLWKLLSDHFQTHTITMHNQETADENEFFEKKTGAFLDMYVRVNVKLDFFEPTGVSSLQSMIPYLKNAYRTILVHNSFTSEEDVKKVKQQMPNTFWCLCPNANQYIENAMPPIHLLRKQQVPIVLGTDSYASNWSLHILDEIKTIQKFHPEIPLAEMLGWATLNGARALQMDKHLGSFDKGKKPGVISITDTVKRWV